MKTIKGPAIFLAQFVGDDPPFNTLNNSLYFLILTEDINEKITSLYISYS